MEGLAGIAHARYRAIRNDRFMYSVSGTVIRAVRFICAQAGQSAPAVVTWAGLDAEPSKMAAILAPAKLDDTWEALSRLTYTTGGLYELIQNNREFWLRVVCALTGLNHANYADQAAFRADPTASALYHTNVRALAMTIFSYHADSRSITQPLAYPIWSYVPRQTARLPSPARETHGYLFTGNSLETPGMSPTEAARMSNVFSETGSFASNIQTAMQQEVYNLTYEKPNFIIGFPEENMMKPEIFVINTHEASGYQIDLYTDFAVWGSVDGETWFQLCDGKNISASPTNSSYNISSMLNTPIPIKYTKFEWTYYGRIVYIRGLFMYGDRS